MRTSINSASFAAVAILVCAHAAHAHTWIESIRHIGTNGSFVGPLGYQRGFKARAAGVAVDEDMVYRLTGPAGSTSKTAPMCKDSQQIGMQGSFAKLQAAPQDHIALTYLENGHVTKVLDPRPAGNGTVYVYGTKTPSNSDTLLGIHKQWNAAGTGGNKQGKLLATRFFDDGQCYQDNPAAPISVARKAEFKVDGEVPCQTDLQLPADAGTSGDYTLYWVWDYATMDKTTGKQVTDEFYTACMDISMTAPSTTQAKAVKVDSDVPVLERAISAQLKTAFMADPIANNSLTAAPFNAPAPPADNGNSGSPSSAPSHPSSTNAATSSTVPSASSPIGSNPPAGRETVTVTEPVVTTVYITRDPTSAPTPTSTSSAPNQQPRPKSSSSSSAIGNPVKQSGSGGVFVSGGPTSTKASRKPSTTAPASTLVTSVRASGPPTSIAPFTQNPASVAAAAASGKATPKRRRRFA